MSACSASSGPVSAAWPRSSAKATIATSSVPKTPPSPSSTSASTASPGIRSAVPPGRRPRATGGSVARWAANAAPPPTTNASAATSPAAGATVVASVVASTGPITKITSSSTDSSANAVCSPGPPRSSAVQRARTSDPIAG